MYLKSQVLKNTAKSQVKYTNFQDRKHSSKYNVIHHPVFEKF